MSLLMEQLCVQDPSKWYVYFKIKQLQKWQNNKHDKEKKGKQCKGGNKHYTEKMVFKIV